MSDKYITRRLEDIRLIKNELQENKFDYALVVGHRLKGHGDTFGHLDLSECGKNLEAAIKNNQFDEARALITQFETLVLAKQ